MRLKYAEDFYIRSLLNKVKLQDVMSSPAISIKVDSHFTEVAKIFVSKKIRHLPIVNSQSEVVGLITQRDLYKILPPHKNEDGNWEYDLDALDGVILQNVMTSNPFTLMRDRPLAEALEPMVRHKYGCIPIIDQDKKLCGILTQFDLLKMSYDILQEGK